MIYLNNYTENTFKMMMFQNLAIKFVIEMLLIWSDIVAIFLYLAKKLYFGQIFSKNKSLIR